MGNKASLPDVIVLRKLYGTANDYDTSKQKQRTWKLRRLDNIQISEENYKKTDAVAMEEDEEDFMREVETDKEMRSLINIYQSGFNLKDNNNDIIEEEIDDDDDQQVKMNELLDQLILDKPPDGDGDNKEQEDDILNNDWEYRQQIVIDGEKAKLDGISYVGKEQARNLGVK